MQGLNRHLLVRALRPALGLALLMAAGAGMVPPAAAQSKQAIPPYDTSVTVGDADAGRQLIIDIGCGGCHSIPGVRGADGMVGPPLDHMARRQIIAGMLRNTADNMVRWLRFPQRIVPGNAMPDMGLTEDQARNITAYLYTLK